VLQVFTGIVHSPVELHGEKNKKYWRKKKSKENW